MKRIITIETEISDFDFEKVLKPFLFKNKLKIDFLTLDLDVPVDEYELSHTLSTTNGRITQINKVVEKTESEWRETPF